MKNWINGLLYKYVVFFFIFIDDILLNKNDFYLRNNRI